MQGKTTDKRGEILDAAKAAFAERGFARARIADIARKISMGHGTFYRYFNNKLDIFFSVLDGIFADIARVVADEDPSSTNSLEEYRGQILRVGRRLYGMFLADDRLAQIIFYEAPGVDPELDRRMDEVSAAINRYTEAYLQNGIQKGFLRRGLDARILAKAVDAMIFAGLRDLSASRDKEREAERWLDAVCTLMLEGLGTGRNNA
ncbi:MAG: TetR/AcrR family transcriptional regulator [Pseudomonadota bacterium]